MVPHGMVFNPPALLHAGFVYWNKDGGLSNRRGGFDSRTLYYVVHGRTERHPNLSPESAGSVPAWSTNAM